MPELLEFLPNVKYVSFHQVSEEDHWTLAALQDMQNRCQRLTHIISRAGIVKTSWSQRNNEWEVEYV